MKKRLILLVLLCCLLMLTVVFPVNALEYPTLKYCKNGGVYNIENDEYCFEDNIDEAVAPAGTVKIMTACIAIEYYEGNYDTEITVDVTWLYDVTGFTAGFSAGEVVTADNVIAGLIVYSGNDAAYILANAISGSTESFVKLMNEKAKELGMDNTYYVNPAGTDAEGSYTCVRDVVKISAYACGLPKYLELSDSPSVSLDATNKSDMRTLYNRNYFISNYYNTEYIDSSVMGLNAGMSGNAGWCLAAAGRSDSGLTYIAVVMGGEDPEDTEDLSEYFVSGYEDAADLLEWAYNSFGYFTLVDTSTMICEVPVKLSAGVDHVVLLPEEKIVSFLPLDTDVETAIDITWELYSETLNAPISRGEEVGVLSVCKQDKLLGEVNLVARNNVERDKGLLLLETVKSFFSHPLVIIICILIVLMAIAYTVLMARYLAVKRQVVKYRRRR